jgi:tripeptidyl-peptidase I
VNDYFFTKKEEQSNVDSMPSASGRAYPDVAAQAGGYQVVVGGMTMSVGGTSCSTPVCDLSSLMRYWYISIILQTFAGIVALLNDYRLASGKPPLGFLNPFLYSIGTAGLNDITSGNNPGCGTNGFTARPGWDPVSL